MKTIDLLKIEKKKEYLFFCMEIFLYISFLYVDIFTQQYTLSVLLKFSGIVVCFLYLLFGKKSIGQKQKEKNIVIVAFFFTVLADICLLLRENYEIGLVFFFIVQSCYFYRLKIKNYINSLPLQILSRIIVVLIVLGMINRFNVSLEWVLFLSVCYFVNILWNTGLTILHGNKNYFFMMGMILFLICDINVGIYNMDSYFNFSELVHENVIRNIINFSGFAIWFFYLPAQVLLVLSVEKSRDKRCEVA